MPTLWDINSKELIPIVFHRKICFNTNGKPVKTKLEKYAAILLIDPRPLIIVIDNDHGLNLFVDGLPVIERIRCVEERNRITLKSANKLFRHYYFSNEGTPRKESLKKDKAYSCTLCGDLLQKKDNIIHCPKCKNIFHEDCWKSANGCLSCSYVDKNDGLYSWVPEKEDAAE